MGISDQIIEYLRTQNKRKYKLSESDYLLTFLNSFFPFTGQIDNLYCNEFLLEATQLLINSIFLYEDGFFDCAFYSIRQANEVTENMLYLSINDRKELKKWTNKEKFPFSVEIKSKLEKLSVDYKDIKTQLSGFFDNHADLTSKVNKIIHKQGFDTFYRTRNYHFDIKKTQFADEAYLFSKYLLYSIGIILILFGLLDPISLALADEKIDSKIPYNLITEPINIDFFNKYLSEHGIVEKLFSSTFYLEFISGFKDNEPMLPAVYSVIREEGWDIDSLDEIEKQFHMLDFYQRIMFKILKNKIPVSNFFLNGGLTWYFTTNKSNYERQIFGGEEFDHYLHTNLKFNLPCKNVFISVITIYDEHLYIEHNEPLDSKKITILKQIENQVNKRLA